MLFILLSICPSGIHHLSCPIHLPSNTHPAKCQRTLQKQRCPWKWMAEGLNQTYYCQRKGDPLQVSFLDTHWVQLGRGLKFSILPFHFGARMPQITQRIQTKSHCPFRQWLPFSVISLRPSSGTAIIPSKTSERGVERWQTTNIYSRTGSKLYQTNH